jgi:hypothetical protein
LRVSPTFIVNNSANISAVTHLASEMMMFKGSNVTFVPVEHRGTWWRYIVEPPKSMAKSVFGRAGTTAHFSDLLRPQFYVDSVRNIVDLERATQMDKAGGAELMNRWSARATFAGVTGMLFAALTPTTKDDMQEVERMRALAKDNLAAYMAERLQQAVWFPVEAVTAAYQRMTGNENVDIGKHKREFAGLGLGISGMFSFLSGFRNVVKIDESLPKIASNMKYSHNFAHGFGGIITATAGLNLLFAENNDQGWSRYGAVMLGRVITLPTAIYKKFADGEINAHWYATGQSGFVATNLFLSTFGSAEKLPDGTIIDHKTMKAAENKDAALSKPDAKLIQVAEHIPPEKGHTLTT